MVNILQRIDPSFIFCDADILPMIDNETKMKAKVFTVNENVDGYDPIGSLMAGDGDGDEDSFVCVPQ